MVKFKKASNNEFWSSIKLCTVLNFISVKNHLNVYYLVMVYYYGYGLVIGFRFSYYLVSVLGCLPI